MKFELTEGEQQLLASMLQRGVCCYKESSQYYRSDTCRTCTAEVEGLLDKELLVPQSTGWNETRVVAKPIEEIKEMLECQS